MKKQIISIGGGGFSKGGAYCPDNTQIARYFLQQTGKERPSICFIPTASADDPTYTLHFYQEFTNQSSPSHLSLFAPPTKDIESFILEKDAIYIGGGNTKNMLALWREWGLDAILKKAYDKGIVLGGLSAGMNCWYDTCVTDSLFGELTALKALGFLKGSGCPHYNGERNRRPSYHALMQAGKLGPGIAIDDNTAVHYIDGEIAQVITTKHTTAHLVYIEADKVVEKRLNATKLA